MVEGASLVPRVERLVDFYGDPIVVAVLPDGEVYVPVRPIAEFLGLDWSGQYQRIQRDAVLVRRAASIVVRTSDGSQREMICLPLDLLPGWLFGISASRVKSELAPKLMRYREECFRVLWRAFQADAFGAIGQLSSTSPRETTSAATGLAHIRELGLAIAQMAEQQLALERRVTTHDERLDRAAWLFQAFEQRLDVLEDKLSPTSFITDAQAAIISNQVKQLAELLTGTDKAKNHYQGIFAELYRRFGVSSYKLIRQEQYAAVLQFLEEWRAASR